QPQYKPLPTEHQVPLIFAGVHGFLDKVDSKRVTEFEATFIPHLVSNHPDVLDTINKEGVISDATDKKLREILTEFL
ncbi:9752_t:CDS:1, partial [Racocetra fulgida]